MDESHNLPCITAPFEGGVWESRDSEGREKKYIVQGVHAPALTEMQVQLVTVTRWGCAELDLVTQEEMCK